ncbi:glycosyltransferase family 2 protein [Thermospira aquatica]|uniref:Glycosyltransferase family 2 protein n=1 Tax=Thermospira aquatica TaxID=2828656 RepID=A0AAX3BET3_9SPIR|nr:glycosyltransferase [Thermospira aquatica]URA10852.1 glycosyltransferase family 2 protein [Thermospira aquatica]
MMEKSLEGKNVWKERKVYILLPVHNRKKITEEFIKNLLHQTFKNFVLLLIDDGSTDGTSEMVLSYLPDAVIIRGKGNWWWGGALHQGYKWIKRNVHNGDDFVLMVNDDVSFNNDFLERALLYLDHHPDTLLLAQGKSMQTGEFIDTGTKVDWKNFSFRNAGEDEEIDCLATRGLFFRVKDFIKIGGFHPILLPHYLSDYEFTIRAKRKGLSLKTTSDVFLWVNEATTGYHEVKDMKKVFSKKSSINPFYLTMFIILSCPWKYKLSAFWNGVVKKSWYYLFGRSIK